MNTPALTCFTLSITDHVAHLVLNKPEAMNTMHPTFWRELDAVLAHLNTSGAARALVARGRRLRRRFPDTGRAGHGVGLRRGLGCDPGLANHRRRQDRARGLIAPGT